MSICTSSGIVGARVRGIQEAKGDIFVILDSHIEVVEGWLEPLVKKIEEDARQAVSTSSILNHS